MPKHRRKPSSSSHNNKSGGKRSFVLPRVNFRDPRSLSVSINCRHKFRFRAQSATTSIITVTNATMSRLLMIAVNGSTTSYELMAAFRIVSLEMWLPPIGTVGGATEYDQDASITWIGGQLGKDTVVCADSLSSAHPPYLYTRPPKMSQASFWAINAASTNVTYFSINQTWVNAIIDLVLDFTLEVGVVNTATMDGTGYPTSLIYGRLDGVAGTGIWAASTGYSSAGVE